MIAIIIIPLLSLFWTSTPTHISYILINKLLDSLFNLIVAFELTSYNQRHVFIVACSIYLSIHWHFARPIHLSIHYTLLVQSICPSIALCLSNLSIYLFIVRYLSHLSIALIFLLVAIKSPRWSSVACHLASNSSVKPEHNRAIFLLGWLFIAPFTIHSYKPQFLWLVFRNSWYTYGYLCSDRPMLIPPL